MVLLLKLIYLQVVNVFSFIGLWVCSFWVLIVIFVLRLNWLLLVKCVEVFIYIVEEFILLIKWLVLCRVWVRMVLECWVLCLWIWVIVLFILVIILMFRFSDRYLLLYCFVFIGLIFVGLFCSVGRVEGVVCRVMLFLVICLFNVGRKVLVMLWCISSVFMVLQVFGCWVLVLMMIFSVGGILVVLLMKIWYMLILLVIIGIVDCLWYSLCRFVLL